ncbi:hypothetical protein J6590_086151 [Homalodisca vitripennis]|nr:hypothetical protein J6590_086151 [Homalodisca vitripennis]
MGKKGLRVMFIKRIQYFPWILTALNHVDVVKGVMFGALQQAGIVHVVTAAFRYTRHNTSVENYTLGSQYEGGQELKPTFTLNKPFLSLLRSKYIKYVVYMEYR